MSTYINNLIDSLLSQESVGYLIEHRRYPNWFLFDASWEGKTLKLLWIQTPLLSLLWTSEEAAQEFISYCKLTHFNHSILNLKKMETFI